MMISHNGVRFTQSAQCFAALKTPPGTRTEHYAAGLDLAKARERIATEMSGDWLFFVDDDTLFAPDTITRLLARLDAHPDVDVLATFVLRRWPPHYTVAGRLNADGQTATVQHFQRGSGLVPVELTGLGGGAVIRRRAFERIAPPWFTGGVLTEDWTFCARLTQAGGHAAVDLDVLVGHITPMAVWPSKEEDGQWGVAYTPICDGMQAITSAQAEAIGALEPVTV
jgi:cellulose synthase/poly-beta-1,6-N-acetylglucosamine synthase-like glycosyltransferase